MNQHKRIGLSIAVGVAVFSMVFAVAASLGVTAGTLGAGTTDVTSCDADGVTTNYTTSYSQTAAGYTVGNVSVAGITTPACGGKSMKVTLLSAAGASLGEQTLTLPATVASPTNLDFSAAGILASLISKVAVVISG